MFSTSRNIDAFDSDWLNASSSHSLLTGSKQSIKLQSQQNEQSENLPNTTGRLQ